MLLIGTAPCPDDRERVMTSDMVVPIFPNTAHPRGRRAVRPTRPFPSARAYLWTASEMWVRVRFMPEGTYDNEDAFRLDEAESEALEHVLQEDDARYAELREEMKEKPERESCVLRSFFLHSCRGRGGLWHREADLRAACFVYQIGRRTERSPSQRMPRRRRQSPKR